MVYPPAVGIFKIPLIGIDGVEVHKTFIVDGARPEIACAFLLDESRFRRVGILSYEIVVHTAGKTKNTSSILSLNGHCDGNKKKG